MPDGNGGFEYQFRIADHLNNTRVMFSDGNSDGVVTEDEIIKESHFYPFGEEMSGVWTNATQPTYSYLYNNKDIDSDYGLKLYYYGTRMYDALQGRFTGTDLIAEKFPWVTTYNYAENRVPNAIDLHGLQAFLIHGTNSSPSRWDENVTTSEVLTTISGNTSINANFSWEGLNGSRNNQQDRAEAALNLANHVMENLVDGEDVTLIGHSHGGNVAIQAVNTIAGRLASDGDKRNVNLITIATPAYNGENDPENPENTNADNHLHIYNDVDGVQTTLASAAGSKKPVRTYDNENTNNVNVDVNGVYRFPSPMGTRVKPMDAHSFDIQHPELIQNQIDNGTIQRFN